MMTMANNDDFRTLEQCFIIQMAKSRRLIAATETVSACWCLALGLGLRRDELSNGHTT